MSLYRVCLLSIVCGVLFFAGCAQNVVHLSYPPAGERAASPVKKKSLICVVDFVDARGKSAIGSRLNGEVLVPRTLVERWLPFGVAEELLRAGYAVILAETLADALAENPQYIVTGEAEEVWLAESSRTRFTGVIRARIALSDGKGRSITANSYSSIYSKAVLPIFGVPQTLLDEALAEMLQSAVRLLARLMP